MAITCPRCGGGIKPKLSKIAFVAGASLVMTPLAGLFGLKAGIIALTVGTLRGTPHAARLLQVKLKLMQASQRMGSFFVCADCGRDVAVSEVFNQLDL